MKYGSQPTVVDGIRFASKKEARRYGELVLLQKAGHISDLACQPKLDCVVNGQLVCSYIADFRYVNRKNGIKDHIYVYEDVKGFKTQVYRLKRKLVKAVTGIEVLET